MEYIEVNTKVPKNEYIEDVPERLTIHNMKSIVSFSHLLGSISGIVTDYITSAFGDGYIANIWNTKEEPFIQRKAAFKDFMMKERPLMIVDPKFDPSEESEFRPLSEFDNDIANDPTDDIAMGARDAMLLAYRENYQLYMRPRRFKMEFGISFIFDTDIQRTQAQQYIRQSIRHRLPIITNRYIENVLPTNYIKAIAEMNGMDYTSKEFLEWVNVSANCPIRYRYRTGSGNNEFFATICVPMTIRFTDGPSSNGPVKRGNIEVSSSFSETVEVEFVAASTYFLRTATKVGDPIKLENFTSGGIEIEDKIDFVSVDNIFSRQIPTGDEIVGDYSKYREVTIQAEKNGDDSINIADAISDPNVLKMIKYYKEHDLECDFIGILMFENVDEMPQERYHLDEKTFVLEMKEMSVYKSYRVVIYIDMPKINSLVDELFKTDKI